MINQKMVKKIVTTEILSDAIKGNTSDKIPVQDLITAMDCGGFGLIMTIFSLPIIIPLPPPFPSLISIPMIIFSLQMMLGYKSPILPKILSSLTIKKSVLATMLEKSTPYINKAEGFTKSRLSTLSSNWFTKIIGLFCFIFSTSVLLPLPLSNFLPGLGVLITSFGLLSKDGVVILLGLIIGSVGVLITTLITLLGVHGLYMAKDFIVNLF